MWGILWPPVNSPYKGKWRGALMFSLICAWINGWVNTREAGDLRCHRTHYDVTVMFGCTFHHSLKSFSLFRGRFPSILSWNCGGLANTVTTIVLEYLTYKSVEKMVGTLQTIFQNAILPMNTLYILVIIGNDSICIHQHWFRWWLGAQCWSGKTSIKRLEEWKCWYHRSARPQKWGWWFGDDIYER